MKHIIILLLTVVFISCNKNTDSEALKFEKPYIISKEDRELQKEIDSINNTGNKIALPMKGFYGESNLIINDSNAVFYYQRNRIAVGCGTGRQNDTLPEFLDLQPKDLVKIPNKEIEKFINENVMNKKNKRQILIIASQNDTIKDKEFLKFFYQMKVPIYEIRRTTQEEDTVLHYKTTNQFYYSDEIKWDKKKIKLKN